VAKNPVMPTARVVEDVRQKITAGELLPGEALPTVTAMGESYEVSKTTVLKALSILRDEGLIYTVPRWGSFVADKSADTPD
jgi:DNA-binding GntR family transcriptional regulator